MQEFAEAHQIQAQTQKPVVSTLPAMIVAGTMWVLAIIVGVLGYMDQTQKMILYVFAGLLVLAGVVIAGMCRHHRRAELSDKTYA